MNGWTSERKAYIRQHSSRAQTYSDQLSNGVSPAALPHAAAPTHLILQSSVQAETIQDDQHGRVTAGPRSHRTLLTIGLPNYTQMKPPAAPERSRSEPIATTCRSTVWGSGGCLAPSCGASYPSTGTESVST